MAKTGASEVIAGLKQKRYGPLFEYFYTASEVSAREITAIYTVVCEWVAPDKYDQWIEQLIVDFPVWKRTRPGPLVPMFWTRLRAVLGVSLGNALKHRHIQIMLNDVFKRAWLESSPTLADFFEDLLELCPAE